MKHPDMCKTVDERISADDFISELNKRIFTAVIDVLHNEQFFTISALADMFTPKEVGLITKLLNSEFVGDNPKDILIDCINVLLNEKFLSSGTVTDDEDWASQMQKIADNKKGN